MNLSKFSPPDLTLELIPAQYACGEAAHRPRAILFVNDNAFAGVCAWCADKAEADKWCREQGLQASHGICPACRARLKSENDLACARQVA